MTTLTVSGLNAGYGRRLVLRNVSLTAAQGVTGVVGPNGAGKSTLLKAVLGLVRPMSGKVSVDGRTVAEARRSIAYLPQRSTIDFDYPAEVRDVVRMGRYPHLRPAGRMGRQDHLIVDSAIERVGLSDFRRRQIGELSGGQQQRMFFARALAQQATLLLLDEPFAGVDVVTVRSLSQLLRDLTDDGVTTVLVNHDLSVVDQLCDQLCLLNEVVIAAGATADVLTAPSLTRTYGTLPPGTPAEVDAR